MQGDISLPKWAAAVICFIATAAIPWAWSISSNVAVIASKLDSSGVMQTRFEARFDSELDKLDARVRNLEAKTAAAGGK